MSTSARNIQRVSATLIALVAALATAATFGVASSATSTSSQTPPAPQRAVSTKDSPGWVPPADPESTAVLVGRRLGAPLVSKRFKGGATSLDDLGRRVCRSLHHGDLDSLMSLCIRDDEFRDIVWRELPQSRPATGLTWEDGWRVLLVRLNSGCSQAVHDNEKRFLEFVAFDSESTAHFKNYDIHTRLTLVVRDDEGQIQRLRWLRAVVERKGSFKIMSTDD